MIMLDHVNVSPDCDVTSIRRSEVGSPFNRLLQAAVGLSASFLCFPLGSRRSRWIYWIHENQWTTPAIDGEAEGHRVLAAITSDSIAYDIYGNVIFLESTGTFVEFESCHAFVSKGF